MNTELEQQRLDMGLSKAQFADLLGIARNSMTVYLRGDKAPPRTVMLAAKAIAHGLHEPDSASEPEIDTA